MNDVIIIGAGVCSPYEMAIAMAENAIKKAVDLHI